MHESDIAIKNEIAKAVVNMGQSKDVIDLPSIISPKINIFSFSFTINFFIFSI